LFYWLIFLPNPLPFETESIDTNIAMVQRIIFLGGLVENLKNNMACLSCPSSIEIRRPLLAMEKFLNLSPFPLTTTAASGVLHLNIDVSRISTTKLPDTRAILWSYHAGCNCFSRRHFCIVTLLDNMK